MRRRRLTITRTLVVPTGVRVTHVETTAEMRDAIARQLPEADVLIMAAAPADFRPRAPAGSKIKKDAGPAPIELEGTPDILADTRSLRRDGIVTVGFALETDNALANARAKLEAKGLDLIALNVAGEQGAGFDVDTNRVTLVSRDAVEELPLSAKTEVAEAILDRIEGRLRGR